MTSNVNNPSHYSGNGIDCIQAMQAAFGTNALKHFCHLNAFKYLWRTDRKANAVEDLQKAQWYINKLIELYETESDETQR